MHLNKTKYNLINKAVSISSGENFIYTISQKIFGFKRMCFINETWQNNGKNVWKAEI